MLIHNKALHGLGQPRRRQCCIGKCQQSNNKGGGASVTIQAATPSFTIMERRCILANVSAKVASTSTKAKLQIRGHI
jgi:hypothetical protein